MATSATAIEEAVETNIPSRMDRLPWSRWHWLIVAGLGITWILDGLEVTIVGALASVLTEKGTLALTESQIGFAATLYLLGGILGALFFGYLTDRLGRKRLFMITLGLYLVSTVLTAFSWSFWSFVAFRFLTGAGIGGEYAAINSAIDELIPARVRGWADLAINGSWWIGTAVGAASTLVLLNPSLFAHSIGWRLCFGLGAILGLAILMVRRILPESPRWLMTHGKMDEAERVVKSIEAEVAGEGGVEKLPKAEGSIKIQQRGSIGFGRIADVMWNKYRKRASLGMALMISQAFMYNAIFFTYALVLSKFYKVPSGSVGLYILPFALGNFLGPLTIGRLFDTIGRRAMIAITYTISGLLLAATAYLFAQGSLTATTQTIAWSVIFFFASASASSAYLTVSEVFPMEMRAMAIAFFYAIGTAAGGLFAPWLFGILIGTHDRNVLSLGYYAGAVLMLIAAGCEIFIGVAAERKPLEEVAEPLSAASPA
jgi:MFS family permease